MLKRGRYPINFGEGVEFILGLIIYDNMRPQLAMKKRELLKQGVLNDTDDDSRKTK